MDEHDGGCFPAEWFADGFMPHEQWVAAIGYAQQAQIEVDGFLQDR